MSEWIDEFFAQIEAHRKRHERELETLMKITGMTIEELDADLTAPDAPPEED